MTNAHLTREQRLNKIKSVPSWDLIIVGGGITGAGIFKLASQLGLKALLLEQKDFAWGSSSRSSKMVHGGLRYIAQGQVKLTRESVHERQRLLNESQGLVHKQNFVLSHYTKKFPSPWIFNLLLSCYDWFAGKKQHRYWHKTNYSLLAPGIKTDNNIGGTQFLDAMTDDARLVYRLIQEGEQLGNTAINYIKVEQFTKTDEKVTGVVACAENSDNSFELNATFVINATGAWANDLIETNEKSLSLRPLRGSHLIIANWRLPVASAFSVPHPKDNRPVQIFPWQNVTIVGTTDVEHTAPLSQEPSISQDELDYLLSCVEHQFPSAKICADDIISTFAGVRPIVASESAIKRLSKDTKTIDPSKEKREHSILQTSGLISISGGKLTIFHQVAKEVLSLVLPHVHVNKQDMNQAILEQFKPIKFSNMSQVMSDILQANYGLLAKEFVKQAQVQDLTPISYSLTLWAELIWAMKYEHIVHLDDLLLRRSRIGNVLPEGGLREIKRIKYLSQQYLHWDDDKWQQELNRYQLLWKNCYSLPIANIEKNE